MAARPRPRRRSCNEAQVGIGTMIVFIATVLVAAVAAAVLLETTGNLQARSRLTGEEATDQVSAGIVLSSIVGRRDTSSEPGLRHLDLFVTLGPGSSPLDLTELRIRVQNATRLATFNYSQAATPGVLEFAATAVRDADAGWSVARPLMTVGDVVNVTLALDANDMRFEPRDEVLLAFIPERGAQTSTSFRTPATYAAQTTVEIR